MYSYATLFIAPCFVEEGRNLLRSNWRRSNWSIRSIWRLARGFAPCFVEEALKWTSSTQVITVLAISFCHPPPPPAQELLPLVSYAVVLLSILPFLNSSPARPDDLLPQSVLADISHVSDHGSVTQL